MEKLVNEAVTPKQQARAAYCCALMRTDAETKDVPMGQLNKYIAELRTLLKLKNTYDCRMSYAQFKVSFFIVLGRWKGTWRMLEVLEKVQSRFIAKSCKIFVVFRKKRPKASVIESWTACKLWRCSVRPSTSSPGPI